MYKSPWFHLGRLLSPTVTIESTAAANADTVSIIVSNLPETATMTPGSGGVPHTLLGNISADTGAGLGGAFTWVRVVITSAAGSAIQVYCQSQQAK